MTLVLIIVGACVGGIALGLGIIALGCWLMDRRHPRPFGARLPRAVDNRTPEERYADEHFHCRMHRADECGLPSNVQCCSCGRVHDIRWVCPSCEQGCKTDRCAP